LFIINESFDSYESFEANEMDHCSERCTLRTLQREPVKSVQNLQLINSEHDHYSYWN